MLLEGRQSRATDLSCDRWRASNGRRLGVNYTVVRASQIVPDIRRSMGYNNPIYVLVTVTLYNIYGGIFELFTHILVRE